MKTFIRANYQKIKDFYKRYERLLMPAMLVVGFLIDYLTFTSIQISTTFVLLFGYWLVAGAVIVFRHVYDAGKISEHFRYVRLFSPLILQFCFGSLLGSSLIFYWFSGAFSISWPIMAIIVVLMISNDRFRHYFEKPLVHLGVYFFATISLCSVLLPFLFNSLSAWLFVAAGGASLLVFGAYVYYLCRLAPQLLAKRRAFFIMMLVITAAMNVLYFTNIIPPIPLALREAGPYYSIKNSQGKYTLSGQSENVITTFLFGQTMYVTPKERVFLYTAVFAPPKLKTVIVHRWEYYDPAAKKWVNKGNLPFNINGGRQEGYKGYSWHSDLAEGKWRVFVQSERGQVLGKVQFKVARPSGAVQLKDTVR